MLPVGAPVPPKAPCAVPRWGTLICVPSSWHPWVRVAAVGWFLTRTRGVPRAPQQTPCSLPSLVPSFSQFSTFPAVAPSQGSCKSKPRPTRPGFVQPEGQSSQHLLARGVLPAPCVLRSGGTRLLQGCGRTPQFYPSCFVCPGLRNTCCSWITGACFHLCSPSPGSRSV